MAHRRKTKSDLANDAIPISTMPLQFAIPEYKKNIMLQMHIQEQFPMAQWLNQPSKYWYEF